MMRRPFFIRILCVNNIKTLKSQTLDRLSNYLSIFCLSFCYFLMLIGFLETLVLKLANQNYAI